MRPRLLIRLFVGAVVTLAALLPATAVTAQEVNITPNFEVTPDSDVTAWVVWMAIGAIVVGVLLIAGMTAAYMRFAPKFFGREETQRLPPGARPPQLARQAAAIRAPVGATRPASAASPSTAPTDAETRPAPAPERAAPARAATPAATEAQAAADAAAATPTAPPQGEPAVQADAAGAAEAAEPEPRPSAKTTEEVGAEPEEAAPTAPVEPAPAEAEAAPEPARQTRAQATTHGAVATMDQDTFDRVLEEQLGKGVDRRVAEGRARAAAVVAARKRAQE